METDLVNMQKILLLAMSIFLRRPAASAFVQNCRSSSTRSRLVATNNPQRFQMPAASPMPMQCFPLTRDTSTSATTALNLLSRGFSSDHNERRTRSSSIQQSSENDVDYQPEFKRGDKVMVEVIFFGPLGASVDIVAHNSHDTSNCIPPNEPALGRGMILQSEIDYFRRGRGGLDVVKFETLPAYVEKVREDEFEDEDGEAEMRVDISLRPPGGKAKSEELGEQILQALKDSDGALEIGDKSSPADINEVFPGASKGAFKKAVSGLYRRGLVNPGPNSISLM